MQETHNPQTIRHKKAVALQYDQEQVEGAPRLVAVGEGYLAEKIIEIAQKENVPIVENQEVVSKLIHFPVGAEIPEELYQAVAEILVYLYRLEKEKGMEK
ncbi:MAG TPA: EscU/YscU/HrcU family type III secretion system export apparatus switch protein [Peptococcaceae bacterium]|jgi:flagellar biosynthesis protein|nr:flagellar biosynthesis [Clostridia bacterium]HOB81279.1 EscU/YscU/HrcU family type III secretion system export apparatus switch protein [Peptococcaceae bacterium]HPZ71749.1 EscU/YscU/HrcU family type III secretion system export apparatus switch protein [Peptococcaceae bacterium]HQD53365.1 EscU/YscU/HrcU family type III secretion system export apparatus switch protein [Peptococcaceae bacterium]